MIRSRLHLAARACALAFSIVACSKGASSGTGGGTGGVAPIAGGAAGTTVVGTSGTGTVATAGTSGGAGTAAPANMPDATCLAGSSHMNPACESCSCTPDASNGCLTELGACVSAADAMSGTMCKAIIDCATKNKCTGNACITPCMTEITAAAGYMSGAPLSAATAVGTCTMMKCGTVCP